VVGFIDNSVFVRFLVIVETHVFRRFRKIAKSDYSLYRVRLSVHMEQLDSHWMNQYVLITN
jgi:hypothetical protein